jgi:hypothetical protein|tara:strand:- start:9 stop:881 length:873 start_codon:yes stop_codon:yes gene_type:complete
MANISTLVKDIMDVVDGKGGWDQAITEYLSETIAQVASERFGATEEKPRDTLSLSGIGKPCERQLWSRVNEPYGKEEVLGAELKGTFFYGDLLEALVIALAKAAGHDVQGEQDVLYVNGIKGHRDCVIDGMTIDVKSASNFSFEKFKRGDIASNDPFGYMSQLSSYTYAGKDDPLVTNKTQAAFLVIKKDRFELCLDVHDFSSRLPNKEAEVQHKKDMVKGPMPAIPAAAQPVPQTKTSPNMKLSTLCTYCFRKKQCWPAMRTFQYSGGPSHLVTVVKEPNVPEIGKKVW